jgi:glycosyltransferase involved in cell wall biosynthesis
MKRFTAKCLPRRAAAGREADKVRAVVSYPGNFMDAQQAARAFYERGALAAFVTGLVFDDSSFLVRLSAGLPSELKGRIRNELRRRAITQVPRSLVVSYPWLEALRTSLSRFVKNPVYADMAWDAMSHRFDRIVSHRHLDGIDLVYAFEYTAQYTFEQAKRRGVARVLAMPSTDSKEFEDIKNREELRFEELRGRHHRYFAERFVRRYERRCAEIALADLIVANSEMTKRSHVRAGADPAKIVVVPLAAPPPIAAIIKPVDDIDRPLSVVWAGSMSIRKGAHYFLEAWRALAAGTVAQARVYGSIGLPERVLRPMPAGLELMGSVPQTELFAAFEQADILVFPTLADGFGMVVPEAFSRGLPVIATTAAGASDLVQHGRNGLIVPAADSAALVDALRWCLDNRRALYQMRFDALETARHWQWPDYRRLLIAKITEGLRHAGYAPDFRLEAHHADGSGCTGNYASAS